jgi:hypothetical protein
MITGARATTFLASAMLFAFASSDASAQTADDGAARAPLRDALVGPARDAYDDATMRLNRGDDRGAIDRYEQAYDLSKDPRLLFDMAVCDRNLRRYALMQALLLRYEQEAAAQISPAEKADLQAALAATHRLLAQIRLTVSEAEAQVWLDGTPVGRTPLASALVVDAGRHSLAVRKDGFDPVERALDLAGGAESAVSLQLVERPAHALLRLAADPVASIAWIAAGVAVAAGVSVGAYFLLRSEDSRGERG